MKAVRLHAAGDLRVEDIPLPAAPEPGWVALRVTAAGICGSDLHNFRTGQWISRSPSVAGHELTGTVTALGQGVEGLAVGDSVVADSRVWCGACAACRAGRHHLCQKLGFVGEVCDGGFAEHTVLPARLLHKVDPGLPPAIAAMAEPFAVALHAVRRLRPEAGEPVLVVGCGPIGGLAALILSRLHDGPLLLADRNADRAALVAEIVGGRRVDLTADSLGVPPRFGIDATGSVPALRTILDLVGGGASIALVGIGHGGLDLDPNILVEREIALLGCHAFAGELPEAIAMLGGFAAALARLIDAQISLDDVPAAYARLLAGEARGLKTIIVPGKDLRP